MLNIKGMHQYVSLHPLSSLSLPFPFRSISLSFSLFFPSKPFQSLLLFNPTSSHLLKLLPAFTRYSCFFFPLLHFPMNLQSEYIHIFSFHFLSLQISKICSNMLLGILSPRAFSSLTEWNEESH